ncbi:MAG: polysaccharide pyruvyl transferase family protein [Acidobacteria bacterium]|nr:polysaccharide pyruvyl transferase family protein [Acidobacteriota bacterium]
MHTRRTFLAAAAAAASQRQAILLRSGWQTVNIGDIAHTPGVLRLLERRLPGVSVILWPGSADRGVEPMLRRAFPRLRLAQSPAEVRDAFQSASLFLHGSAPSITAQAQMEEWRKATGKPYGCFGVTIPALNPRLQTLLEGASFVFTRETRSLENLKQAGLRGPKLAFAPDGTFSFDLRDDEKGERFLKENGLERGKFIAVVPRLRYTPYHKIRKVDWLPEEIQRRTEANERSQERDHSKLREAIVAWVRKTGGKALLCPEMTYEIGVLDPLLYDPLPEDVKPRVVRRKEFWLPDEAASIYRQAALVASFECHSPIIAAVQGTPCLYVHQPEDGIKGQMWKDIGLADWYYEVEETTGAALAARVLEIGAAPELSRRKVRGAVAYAQRLQSQGMKVVRDSLSRHAPTTSG